MMNDTQLKAIEKAEAAAWAMYHNATANAPEWMRRQRRWFFWRLDPKGEDGTTKPPYRTDGSGKNASSTNPDTWRSLAEIEYKNLYRLPIDAEAIKRKPNAIAKGLAFNMLGVTNFVGIDIDHCIIGGGLTGLAREIVDRLDSYTEISPGGDGLRIFIAGCHTPADIPQGNSIELYSGHGGRYLSVTGNVFENRSKLRGVEALEAAEIDEAAQAAVMAVYEQYKPAKRQSQQPALPAPAQPAAQPAAYTTTGQMTRDAAKLEIKRRWRELILLLSPGYAANINGEPSYICPICRKPDSTSTHSTGLTLNPKSKSYGLHCFRPGCFSGDIIDLYQRVKGVNNYTAINELAAALHLDIAKTDRSAAAGNTYNPDDWDKDNLPWDAEISDDGDTSGVDAAATAAPAAAEPAEPEPDYTEYYEQCFTQLEQPEAMAYLEKRRISIHTAAKYRLGYDASADPASAPGGNGSKKHPAQRLIIPITKGFYTGRRIDGGGDFRYSDSGGSTPVFNADALYTDKVVFVTEGIIDALAVIQAGYSAVALHNTNSYALYKLLKAKATKAMLILALDNDDAGISGAARWQKALAEKCKVSVVTANICCGFKDPAAAWEIDPEEFKAAVAAAASSVTKPGNMSQYMFSAEMLADMEVYKTDLKTGWENLDRRSGGLYAGLYFLAATPSLGKTTFVHQMADALAAAGHDVLFFSLEQSRLELAAKSLAREIAMEDPYSEITSLTIRKGLNADAAQKAAKSYLARIGDRLTIIEGNFNVNVDAIKRTVDQYIWRTGIKPVVMIDYLQILQPLDDDINNRITGIRETIDHSVTALKRYSRDAQLPILCISSVNRSNYLAPIDFESFKESGGIEFSADVVFGLQLQCLNDPLFQEAEKKMIQKRELIRREKTAIPRKIELRCIKNRYGTTSYDCYFKYNPAQDYFVIDTEEEQLAATRAIAGNSLEWDDEIEDDEPRSKRRH